MARKINYIFIAIYKILLRKYSYRLTKARSARQKGCDNMLQLILDRGDAYKLRAVIGQYD